MRAFLPSAALLALAARRAFFALVALWLGATIVGCAPRQTLTDWPARDALYRRHCEIEIRRGRLAFAEFDACVHRLSEHRGEPCTHGRAR